MSVLKSKVMGSHPINLAVHCIISVDASAMVIAAIQRLLSTQSRPVVVALDGGSGAGKSTLARLIQDRLEAALIPIDDFLAADIPDSRWDEFSIEERLRYVVIWRQLRESTIEPLFAGEPARWYAFDFVLGLRPDGTYGMLADPTIRDANVILLEGTYTAGPGLADLVDLAILVDVPIEGRYARQEVREDADFLEEWHRHPHPERQRGSRALPAGDEICREEVFSSALGQDCRLLWQGDLMGCLTARG
jgi:para-aminobenzoate synthetase